MGQRVIQQGSNAANPLRVYIVEDSGPILESLIAMFDGLDGVLTVGCATGADEAIHGIRAARPQAAILDIRLAHGNGLDVLRAVHESNPEIEIYMLSNFASEPYRRLAAKLGAKGFFDKSTEFEQMRQLIAARARDSRSN